MDKQLLELLQDDLASRFEITSSSLPAQNDYYQQLKLLKKFLMERIDELIVRDFQRFMNTLYRIDVDESKVRYAFSKENDRPVSEVLAELIIERQIQRIKTRLYYTSKKDDEKSDDQ